MEIFPSRVFYSLKSGIMEFWGIAESLPAWRG